MAAVRDDFSGRKDRRSSKNLRQEYTTFINLDPGLVEARRWIERITFTPFKNNDFRESLVDGVLLCELVVNVASISIGRINRSSTQYASTDNLKLFHRACEALGFENSQLFEITDLQEVPVKRGQSVTERARESQKRLAKVALTVYWLGKYANDNLNFSGSSKLDESCFQHLLQNQLPELPELEVAETKIHSLNTETVQAEPKEPLKDKNEIVTETIDFATKRETFKHLEEESKKVQEEVEKRRRRSFSASEKENEYLEDIKDRRKSVGSKPVWKEGDSRYKHKKEILGGWRDPIKDRRERIVQSGETSPKENKPVGLIMRSPNEMRDKLSRYEQMHRQASEESEFLQGKRSRPKSWGGGELKGRGGSLVDKTTKFESLQRQADKESAVLHGELRMPAVDNDDVKRQNRLPVLTAGTVKLKDKHSKYEKLDKTAYQQTLVLEGKHRQAGNDFEYDIGDKVSGPISLPGAVDVKLHDKKRQFESLDYRAQRESSILKLHSGKSFDDPNQQPIPLNTASRRAEPRPKSNVYDYQRFPDHHVSERKDMDVDMRNVENEGIQSREMNFMESSPEQYEGLRNDRGSGKDVSPTPTAPPRGDSLRYNSLTKRPEDTIRKDSRTKTGVYSSFAKPEEPTKDGTKRPTMNYKEFVSYPVTKQRDRVERYNAAIEQLSKEPERKNVSNDQATTRPRKKSVGNDEWIKVKPIQEPEDDVPKRRIQKLWDKEPQDEDGNESKKRSQPVDTSFSAVEKSTYVPNVKNMRYKDFAAPPKSVVKDHVVMSSAAPVVESSGQRTISGNGPFSNFAQQPNQDPKKPAGKVSMTYKDFAVPPPKTDSTSSGESEAEKAKRVKDLTKRFMQLEAEQTKPKQSGPPQLKSLVDRDELVRYERESRARSWYGGPLGLDDEEYEGAYRRRVRRWSDYEYEEGDKTKSSPWEQQDNQNGEMQEQKYPDTRSENNYEQYQSYNGSLEPEIQVREKTSLENSREGYEPQQLQSEPTPYIQSFDIQANTQNTKPIKSILYHTEPSYSKPEPVEPSQKEQQESKEVMDSNVDYRQPPTSTHVRTIGTRSWNDFESSRRKKSMELIEKRPTFKPYEPREQETFKADVDMYKLKRPADYLQKYKADQEGITTYQLSNQPTNQQTKPAETYQHHFQHTSQDDNYEEPMPTSYPTYYQPEADAQHPRQSSQEVVETGKPIFVNAQLRDEKQDSQPVHKPPPSDQAYEFVTSENSNFRGSQPNLESSPPPKTDFKTQQTLWENLSNPKYGESEEEPPEEQEGVEKFQVKEPLVDKHVARQPEEKRYVEPEVQFELETREVESVPPKPKRQQFFAIVGQGKQVRPLVAEVSEPIAVPQEVPKEKTVKQEPTIQEQAKPPQHSINRKLISPSLSGAKVFNFGEQGEENSTRKYEHTEKQVITTKKDTTPKEETVVMESVSFVERGRGVEEDIFKALEQNDDDKLRRNIQNPEYREKLRKEVEEKNRKQREETRYLTNVQMRQSLGPKEDSFLNDEEGRVRQKHFEGLENAGENTLSYIYDHNANRKDERAMKDDHYYDEGQQTRYGQQDSRRGYDGKWNIDMPERNDPQRHYEKDKRGKESHIEEQRKEREGLEHEYRERERLENERKERLEFDRREQERFENERREQERIEYERQERERIQYERRERERIEYERRERERIEYERREQERLEMERRERERLENERREQERLENERRERERIENERREQERIENERREQERIENERREQERIEYERREQERREKERIEYERREQERLENERREQERIEYERRKEQERLEYKRREQERIEYERREQERLENERREQERIKYERQERERIEFQRREQERIEYERRERERLENERREQEQLENERREQERLEKERREQERIEYEQRREQQQLENERREQERIEYERREQERLEHEQVEKKLREQERKEQEHWEQERRTRELQDRERREHDRRRRPERYDPYDRERYEREPYRDRYERDRIPRDRKEQERHDQEQRERERRERHRREQENLGPEERERHRREQQRRVHELMENQEREQNQQYRQDLYASNNPRQQSDGIKWSKIEDGSRYSIYETLIGADQRRVVCTSCGQSINKDMAMFVKELNRYWHKNCFHCVVCQVIFGSKEQRSPLMVSNSLLHCENCFITNEGEKYTEV